MSKVVAGVMELYQELCRITRVPEHQVRRGIRQLQRRGGLPDDLAGDLIKKYGVGPGVLEAAQQRRFHIELSEAAQCGYSAQYPIWLDRES